MEKYDLKESCQTAYNNIKKHIVKTPLFYSENLSSISDSNVFLKLENFQHTGSFKFNISLSVNRIMLLVVAITFVNDARS